MHIHLYVDSEFTSLERPKLISFAAVTDDSRECYIEVDLEGRRGKVMVSESSTFVIDTVLPQLRRYPTAIVPSDQVGHRLADWLLEFGAQTIYVTYDYSTDFDLMERALRDAGRWDDLSGVLEPTHVAYLLGQPEVEEAMERSWAQSFVDDGLERHHALADARALRAGFHAAHGSPAANDDVASFDAEGFASEDDTVVIHELDPKIVAISADEAQLLEGTVARWNLLAADGIDDALPASVRHDAPLVFLDIDDVICLSEQYSGHDAVRWPGARASVLVWEVQREPR